VRHVRPIALVLALLFALQVAPAGAIDLDEYRAVLEAVSASLSDDPADTEAVLAELRGIDSVTLDNGATVTPDLSLIIAALEAEPPDVDAAQRGIETILAGLALAETSAIDGAGAGALLDEVLARDEFQPEPEEDESPSIMSRILGWVNRQVESFFNWLDDILGGQGGEGSAASFVMAMVGVLAIVGIVAFAVRSVRQSMTPGVTRLAEGHAEDHYTSAQARAEADRLFASGEYRAALRLLYLATLIRWEEAGRLRFDRSLTNREVVGRVTLQGDAALLEQLSPLVDRFDRVWYGGAPCTSADYTSFAALAERAWEAA
jgi:hypothetical protein